MKYFIYERVGIRREMFQTINILYAPTVQAVKAIVHGCDI